MAYNFIINFNIGGFMSKLEITGIVSLVIVLIACVAINAWYLVVKFAGPKKVVSHTYEIGLQQIVEGDTKYFIEVNSYDDCFEVRFNYMLDENKTDFYTQGIQLYGKDINFELSTADFELENKRVKDKWLFLKYFQYDQYQKYVLTSGDSYYYMLEDDSKVGIISSNPVDEDFFFKIDLDGQLYGMKLKGKTKEAYLGSNGKVWDELIDSDDYINYYLYYDMELILKLLYDSVNSLPYGTNDARVFEFGNYFEYYEYKDDGIYSADPVAVDKADLINKEVKSYYSIKITKHEGNIQKSSQSLFGSVAGNSNMNLTDITSDDYFYGRTIITADNNAFTRVKITENHIALKLKEEFITTYLPYVEKMQLQVLIDLDSITADGLEFVGFTADSGLENFNILSCQTMQTIDGELVYSEVAYDS